MVHKIILILITFLLFTPLIPQPAFCAIQTVEYLCETGVTFYRAGKFDVALMEFKKALMMDPSNQTAKTYINNIFKQEVSPQAQISQGPEEKPSREEVINKTLSDLSKEEPKSRIEGEPPAILSGEYRLSMGITPKDVIWKDANADKVGVPREKNWRYLWGDKRHNTYDPKIYDRLNLDMETQFDNPLNAFMEITIDPWTFVGKNHVTVTSTAGGDAVDMDLKYWSNDRSTIDEIYRSKKGNIISIKPIKVHEGKTTTVYTPTGITGWATTFNSIESMEVNRDYRPIRKFWFDYKQEDYSLKVFPISDQFEALTSDDPLLLSNNHVYWEESPWLDEYEPSRIFTPDSGLTPIKKGRWIRKLSFVTKDSSDDYPHRLTFLRGASFKFDSGAYVLETTVAAPISLWDDYENANSIDEATRLKIPLTNDLQLGLTETTKVGVNGGSAEAFNQLGGTDLIYKASEFDTISAEVASSYTEVEEAKDFNTTYDGMAVKLAWAYDATKKKEDGEISQPPYYNGIYKGDIYAVHMDNDFYPGLSNYRYTRRDDPAFSRNIYFAKIAESDKPSIWGNGVDRGRDVIGINLAAKAFEEKLDVDIKFRNVHKDDGDYIESALRNENTYRVTPRLTTKLLGYYAHLPKTVAGYDPIVYTKTMYSLTDYFSEEDLHPQNDQVLEGKNPSIGSFGFGAKYALIEQLLAVEGIYERTNDPLDFPRGLLNNTIVTTETRDGHVWDKVVPFLYDQRFFGLPPYDYYSIAKSRFIYTPTERWEIILGYTYNENKHATGIDNNINHTSLEATYFPNDKLTFWLKYIYSKTIDVYKQNKYQSDNYYEPHHNFFFGSEYKFNKDESFTLLYGEFVEYDDSHAQANWTLSALDTQHLFRLFYRRKF